MVNQVNEALDSLIALGTLYQEYDIASEMLKNRLGTSLCVQCGKCCEQNTPFAYGLEGANAVSHLMGKGLAWTDIMQRRIEGWLLDHHSQCPTYEPLKMNKFSFGLDKKIRDEALALSRVQCPFLENKNCLIHSYRPLICRAHGVTRAISDGCSRKPGRGETLTQRSIVGREVSTELRAERDAVLDMVPKDTWKHAGFLPTIIYSLIWPEKFARLVENGQIATAKLVMTYPTLAVIFQEQVESLAVKDLVLV